MHHTGSLLPFTSPPPPLPFLPPLPFFLPSGDTTAAEVDEAASSKWLANRSKPCPKCKYAFCAHCHVLCSLSCSVLTLVRAPIERTEGCNHMCCRKVRLSIAHLPAPSLHLLLHHTPPPSSSITHHLPFLSYHSLPPLPPPTPTDLSCCPS